MSKRIRTTGQAIIYIQCTTQKTNDRTTRTPLKIRDEFRCSGRVGSFWSTYDTRLFNFAWNGKQKFDEIFQQQQ